MRKVILAALAITIGLIALGVSSVVRIPAGGGAWCQDHYLGPGLQIKSPLARVARFEPADQLLQIDRVLEVQDGDAIPFSCTVHYRWDFQRLPTEAVDPRSVEDRFEQVLQNTERSSAAAGLGLRAEQDLRRLIDELPIITSDLRFAYPTPEIEALREAARPTGEKVVVVGMDGFDWVLLDRLIESGRCPTFARMKREGAWGEIISRPPVLSPLIWTTMATGRLPEDHGVLDFVVHDPVTGKDAPITNQSRKVQAFWNILSIIGRTVHLVNWWASYPAEDINGVMVSERVFYQLFGIRPSLDDPANVSPADTLEKVKSLLVEADDITFEEIRTFAQISRADFDAALEEARLAENPYDNRINHLRKIIAVTRGVFNVGRWLLEERPADLTVLYIEGTDTIGHRFAHFLPPRLDWIDPTDYARYRDTMAHYYELCDRSLAELMEHAPPETTWLVVADHGFYTGAARPSIEPDDFVMGAPQWHRMVGVYLASGPHVQPGKIPHVHIDDLGRTLLWLSGAPASKELRGKELTTMMRPEWVAAHPPTTVDTFDDLPRAWLNRDPRNQGNSNSGSVLDAARMAELQALGYISDEAAPTPQDTAGSETQSKATEPYNRANIAHRNGDLAAAEQLYLQALELDPDFALAMFSLASVYGSLSQHEDSLRWTLRALETNSEHLPNRILLDFVSEADAAGRLDRALPALEMIRARWDQTSTYFTARGRAYELQGQIAEAEREYLAALDLDPGDAVATEKFSSWRTAAGPWTSTESCNGIIRRSKAT